MTFSDPGPQPCRSSFEAWADSQGSIEFLPLMVQVQATALVVDCIIESTRLTPPEPVRDLGHPAVLSLQCSAESIGRAHEAVRRLIIRNETFQLLRLERGVLMVLQAEAEMWMLEPVPA